MRGTQSQITNESLHVDACLVFDKIFDKFKLELGNGWNDVGILNWKNFCRRRSEFHTFIIGRYILRSTTSKNGLYGRHGN